MKKTHDSGLALARWRFATELVKFLGKLLSFLSMIINYQDQYEPEMDF